jgi:hypothetical protein
MSILDGLRDDESFDSVMEFADLEEPEDGLIKGPIDITYTCGHDGKITCIETTVKHVKYVQTGPCYDCWKQEKL